MLRLHWGKSYERAMRWRTLKRYGVSASNGLVSFQSHRLCMLVFIFGWSCSESDSWYVFYVFPRSFLLLSEVQDSRLESLLRLGRAHGDPLPFRHLQTLKQLIALFNLQLSSWIPVVKSNNLKLSQRAHKIEAKRLSHTLFPPFLLQS